MSTFTLLPVVKVEDITQMYALPLSLPERTLTNPSLYGGSLMVIIGLLYLFFEYLLLRNTALDGENATARPSNPTSRIMIGVQVCPSYPTLPHPPYLFHPALPQSTSVYPAFSPQTNTH